MSLCASQGHSVVATSRELDSSFTDWCDWLSKETKTSIIPETLNLEDSVIAQNQARKIVTSNPSICHFVNNAGMPFGSTFMMTSIKDLKRVQEVNFFSQFAISQVFIKHLLKLKGGTLVNISSITSSNPIPGALAYGSSKSSIDYLTRIMALELVNSNISVGAVALGLVDTEMLQIMDEKSKEFLRTSNPLIEILQPNEVAQEIYRFVSELSPLNSGTVKFVLRKSDT